MNRYFSHKHFINDIIGSESATGFGAGGGSSIQLDPSGGLTTEPSGLRVLYGQNSNTAARGDHFHSNYLINAGDIVLSQNNGIYSISLSGNLSAKTFHKESTVIVNTLGVSHPSNGSKGMFDVSGITPGATRTLTFPDTDGVILVQSGQNQFVINDGIPPTGVNITSLTTAAAGQYASITVNWAFPDGYIIPTDLNYFVVAYKKAGDLNWTEIVVADKNARSFTVSTLIFGAQYSFKVLASDISNNRSNYSAISSRYAISNSVPPTAPPSIYVTNPTGNYISAIWTPVDVYDLQKYELYYGDDINFIPSTGNRVYSGINTSCYVNLATIYPVTYFKVVAINYSGVSSNPPNIYTLESEQALQAPNLSSVDITTGLDTLGRSYINIAFIDGIVRNEGFLSYVYQIKKSTDTDWTYFQGIAGDTIGTFRFEDVIPNTNYQIGVAAVSTKGVTSTYTSVGTILSARDTTPPPKVSGVTVSIGYSDLIVSWAASGVIRDIERYEVCVSNNAVFDPDSDASTIKYSGLSNSVTLPVQRGSATYYIKIRAIDTSGNKGVFSDILAVQFDTSPSYPEILSKNVTASLINNSTAALAVSFLDNVQRTSSNHAFYAWRIKRSSDILWTEIVGTSSPSLTFSNLIPNTLYDIGVKAVSNIGLSSSWTSLYTSTLTTKDTIAPVLTSLSTVAGYNSIIVSYSCTASDLAYFKIYSSTSGSGFVVDSSTLKYTGNSNKVVLDVSRQGATTWWVKVQAFDTSDNPSNILTTSQQFDVTPQSITSISLSAMPVSISSTDGNISSSVFAQLTDSVSRVNTNFAYYEWRIKQSEASQYQYFIGPISGQYLFQGLLPFITYNISACVVYDTGLRSSYISDASISTNKNTIAPSPTSDFGLTEGFGNVRLDWVNPSNRDIELIEITRSLYSNVASGTVIASTIGTSYVDNSVKYNQPYYYFTRVKNTSGLYSTYASAGPNHSIQLYPSDMSTEARVDFTMKDILFSFASTGSTTLNYTSPSGTGYIYRNGVAYSRSASGAIANANNKYIIATCVSGSNTVNFRAIAFGADLSSGVIAENEVVVAFTSSSQSSTGYYQCYVRQSNSMAIDGAIIHDATINNAKIKSLKADKIEADGILASTITLGNNGPTLQSVSSSALNGEKAYADPIARANQLTTTIKPGLVSIIGSGGNGATLGDWITPNTTTIDGGKITANSISANKISLNARGITAEGIDFSYTPTTDTVKWTSGAISYWNDSGAIVTSQIASGGQTYTSGTLYIYYAKGGNSLLTTYQASAANQNDTVCLATYKGDHYLIANYGGTIIAGDRIATGSIDANNIKAGSITSASGVIGSLAASAITTGYIDAARIQAGSLSITSLGYNSSPVNPQDILTSQGISSGANTLNGIPASTVTAQAASGAAIAANPVQFINNSSTKIEPGIIKISGGINLDSWITAGQTTINGGMITANSIKANSLEISQRDIAFDGLQFKYNSPSANLLSWTSGKLRYPDSSNNIITATIASGQTSVAASSASPTYIYWSPLTSGSLLSTTVYAIAATGDGNIVLGTYSGQDSLNINYGKTLITGTDIVTGTVNANVLQALTITSDKIAADQITGNHIQSRTISADNISVGTLTGVLIAAGTISGNNIKAGTITGDKIVSQSISGDKIAANTITSIQISAGSIEGSKIKSGTITSGHVETGTLTGDKIAANTISLSNLEIISRAGGIHEDFNEKWAAKYSTSIVKSAIPPLAMQSQGNMNSLIGQNSVKITVAG